MNVPMRSNGSDLRRHRNPRSHSSCRVSRHTGHATMGFCGGVGGCYRVWEVVMELGTKASFAGIVKIALLDGSRIFRGLPLIL